MLQNRLSDIPALVLLRSDLILKDLIDSLLAPIASRPQRALHDVFEQAVHSFRPNRFRRSDIESASRTVLEEGYSPDYKFDFVAQLFNRYFEFDGSKIVSKSSLADDYSTIVRNIDPFVVIGYQVSLLIEKCTLSINDVVAYANHITPLGIGRVSCINEYAENHLHLGGANDPHDGLLTLANEKQTRDIFYTNQFINDLPRLTAFQLVSSQWLTFGQLVDLFKETHRAINRYALFGDIVLQESIANIRRIIEGHKRHTMRESGFTLDFFLSIPPPIPRNNVQRLFGCMVDLYAKGCVEKAWFINSVFLHSVHSDTRTPRVIRLYVKIFFHLTHILRSYMVMSQNLGLAHFKEFFDSALRRTGRKFYDTVARNITMNGTTHLEAKLSPDAVFKKEYLHFMEAFDAAVNDDSARCVRGTSSRSGKAARLGGERDNIIYPGDIPYHFCVHFIRKKDKPMHLSKSPMFPPRHIRLRELIKNEARALERTMSGGELKRVSAFRLALQRKGLMVTSLRTRPILEGRHLDLTRLFTTLDVAGNEIDAPPEVFAPAIRFLRREVRPFMGGNVHLSLASPHHHGRFRLSVHAGEDFAHIVTGLRRIDETVCFYDFSSNDRLGHALALGINPLYWAERTNEVYVTVEEHLDNLVWLWKRCTELGMKFPPAVAYAKKCEGEIGHLARQVYSVVGGYGILPQDLYDAWELRRNCPLTYLSRGTDISWRRDEFVAAALPDFLLDTDKAVSTGIFVRYHTDHSVRKAGKRVLSVRYVGNRREARNDNVIAVTEDDLLIFEALQDFIITRYADKGIVIETNPSSNIFISDISAFHDHPIFRWNPPKRELLDSEKIFNRFGLRTGPIKVCINTDDPSIFLTTLQNEFRLIKKAACDKFGCSEPEADEWIDKIRTGGMNIFQETHVDPFVS